MAGSKPLLQPGRLLVIILCVSFLVFGVISLVLPGQLMQLFEIQLNSVSGFSEVRAMYGGLCIGIGVALFMGLRRAEWYAASLFLVMAISAGLAGGRFFSIIMTGIPNAVELFAGLLLEILSLVLAVRAYRKFKIRNPTWGH